MSNWTVRYKAKATGDIITETTPWTFRAQAVTRGIKLVALGIAFAQSIEILPQPEQKEPPKAE